MDKYQKEKLQRYRDAGMYECCGIPNPIGEDCRFRLCPVTREKELLKAKKEASISGKESA